MLKPNRIAVYLTSFAGLATALVPVVANLDITSTVGVVGGFAGIAGVVSVWLKGWQAHEARHDVGVPLAHIPTSFDAPADLGDPGHA